MGPRPVALLPKVRPWAFGDELRSVSFEVLGIAQPKGSLSAFVLPDGRARVTEPRHHKAWQREVRDGALLAIDEGGPLTGPLFAQVVFYLPRPKGAPKTRRTAPAVRPDVDKLLRSTLDGLRGVVIGDDAQIVACVVGKVYSSRPRVRVSVRGVSVEDMELLGAAEEDEVMQGGR
jgi:Holliday junction resolvase RusA-like endonuclease